jgi:hypothetical protein
MIPHRQQVGGDRLEASATIAGLVWRTNHCVPRAIPPRSDLGRGAQRPTRRVWRHAQNGCRFVQTQPTEEAHLDDAALSLVKSSQGLEALIECDEVLPRFGGDDERLVERDHLACPPALLPLPRTSMIHENASHHARRDPEEMCAVVPSQTAGVDESEVRLVDEGRRLKAVIRSLVAHVPLSDSVKLIVY